MIQSILKMPQKPRISLISIQAVLEKKNRRKIKSTRLKESLNDPISSQHLSFESLRHHILRKIIIRN